MRGDEVPAVSAANLPDWPPSRDEVELAVELLDALDAAVSSWYGRAPY